MGLPLRAWVDKTVGGVEKHGQSSGTWEDPLTIDFLEKGVTVTSTSYN